MLNSENNTVGPSLGIYNQQVISNGGREYQGISFQNLQPNLSDHSYAVRIEPHVLLDQEFCPIDSHEMSPPIHFLFRFPEFSRPDTSVTCPSEEGRLKRIKEWLELNLIRLRMANETPNDDGQYVIYFE